jgi:Ala-tRNA(Pro) deacylase
MVSLTPATRAELMARLDQLRIVTRTVEHQAVFTVAESDAVSRDISGGHTKNLFLKDSKGALFLVVAEAHTAVDLKGLHKILGCGRFSFGKPDLLMSVLGVPPGSVTAFSLINDADRLVSVVIDKALMAFDAINCHPLTNTATTTISREDLFRFMRATGHEPRIAQLTDG